MGSLRRPLLATALLGAAVLALAAAGLAGPLDPAPDEAGANATTQTGTAADDVASVAGLEKRHDIEASVDDWASVSGADEAADADTQDGTVTAGGAAGTPTQTVQAPSPVSSAAGDARQETSEVQVALTFSQTGHLGTVLETGHDASPIYWEQSGILEPDETHIALGLSASDEDYDPSGGDAAMTGVQDIRSYYATSVPRDAATTASADDPDRVAPVDGSDGGSGSDDGSGSGSASTQSAKSSPGLSGVIGVDNRAEAVAVAAATALPILAWSLYHRIKGHDVLENETRKAIYDEVCGEPGLGVKDLADAADVSYSTASYHLQRLEDADMVVSSKRGKKLCYFQNGGTYSEDERELLKVLRNEEAMRVFLDIHEHPGTYRTRIAERLDVSTTTVNWHLDGLVEAGLVRENRDGRTAHLYVDQERLDDRVRPLLDKTADDEEVEAPEPMTQLRSRLQAPATA